MSQWSEFEKMNEKAAGRGREIEVLACPTCNNTWLYVVQVSQFSNAQIVIGQEPANVHNMDIPMLVCARCGRAVRPNISTYQQTQERKVYEAMLNAILGKDAEKIIKTVFEKTLGVRKTVPTREEPPKSEE